jgi:hypothetical protein
MNRGDSAGAHAKCGIIEKAKVATEKGDRLLTEKKRRYRHEIRCEQQRAKGTE